MGRVLRQEGTAESKRRTEQLLDGANAFGYEEAVALAGVTALQVTGYTEHAHAVGT
ncbi:MAG TPA: hypothetical protein VJO33_17835 [Gemmatimonadaceae bacterium]|nr:hypothetical protein [Gemmatimonadaceae bacterium]